MSKGKRNVKHNKPNKPKKFANIGRNLLEREYARSVKTVDVLQNVCRILSARLYKHMPHDKIFKDETFEPESLKETRKLAKKSWSVLDKMHGKKKSVKESN